VFYVYTYSKAASRSPDQYPFSGRGCPILQGALSCRLHLWLLEGASPGWT